MVPVPGTTPGMIQGENKRVAIGGTNNPPRRG